MALDALDLLIILVLGYVATVALHAVGWELRAAHVGTALAPLVLAGLALRRRLLPPRRGAVKRSLTLLGVVATALLVAGFLTSAAAIALLHNRLAEVPDPISPQDVQLQAEQRARTQVLLDISASVSAAEEGAIEDEEALEYGGGYTEFLAALDAATEPEPAAVAKFAIEVRQEMLEERDHAFAQRQARGRRTEIGLAILGISALLLGAFLDRLRPRHTNAPALQHPPL